MILSPRHKFVFFHIPNAAGRAVHEALMAACDDGNLTSSTLRLDATAQGMKEVMRPRDWDRFTKFAVVRNPWDRLVEDFWFNGGLGREFDTFVMAKSAFTDWVYEEVLNRSEYGPSAMENMVMIDGQYAMDVTIRYENFEYDFDNLAEVLGIKACMPEIKTDEARRKDIANPYTEYYNEDTRILVRRHHHQLLKAVPYTFRNEKKR